MEEEDFVTEEEEEKESFFKKIFIIAGAAFLIFLFTTYLLVDPTVRGILASMIESETMEEGFVVEKGNMTVIFGGESYEVIKKVYYENQEHEFKLCLNGKIIGGEYFVEGVFQPVIISQEFSEVVSRQCPAETIVDLHSHPYKRCIFSQQDIKSFEHLKKVNPEALMMLMCEEDRFNIYQ